VAPQSLPLRDPVRTALFESREPFLASCYLGLGALVLAAAGVAGGPTLARQLAGGGAAALVVGLGRHTVAYSVLTPVPAPLRLLRYPSKALLVTAFAVALLAGIGVEAWRRGSLAPTRPRRIVVGLAALSAVAAAVFAAALFFHAHALAPLLLQASSTDAAERLFAPFAPPPPGARLAAAAIAALVLASSAGSRVRSGSIAAGALALVDLFAAHVSLQPTMPARLLAAAPPTLSAIDRSDGATRVYAFEYGPRVLGRTYRRPERPDAFRAPPGDPRPRPSSRRSASRPTFPRPPPAAGGSTAALAPTSSASTRGRSSPSTSGSGPGRRRTTSCACSAAAASVTSPRSTTKGSRPSPPWRASPASCASRSASSTWRTRCRGPT